MSISYKADKSIVLQGDRDPGTIQVIPADVPEIARDAAIVAFVTADQAKQTEEQMPLPTGGQLAEVLSDPQALSVRTYLKTNASLATQAWWSARYDQGIPLTAPKFQRIATKSGIDPAVWHAAATATR